MMTEQKLQKRPPRWTLRSMFWWTFLVALIIPYVLAWWPGGLGSLPLSPLDVAGEDVMAWLQTVDPSAETVGGSNGGGFTTMTENECGFDFVIHTDKLNSDQVFLEVRDHIEKQISLGLWVRSSSLTSSAQEYRVAISRGYSHYRVYLWNVPLQAEDIEWAASRKKNATRLKWMVLGYSTRYAAKPVPEAKRAADLK